MPHLASKKRNHSRIPHSKLQFNPGCCAPDIYVEPAPLDAPRRKSRKSLPQPQASGLSKIHRRFGRSRRAGYQGRGVRPCSFRVPRQISQPGEYFVLGA